MLEIGLLRKAIAWAEAETEKPLQECEWYQGQWKIEGEQIDRSCGTCYCIAGHIVAEVDGPSAVPFGPATALRAAVLLGVPVEDVLSVGGYGLFNQDLSIREVRWYAEDLAHKYGEEL